MANTRRRLSGNQARRPISTPSFSLLLSHHHRPLPCSTTRRVTPSLIPLNLPTSSIQPPSLLRMPNHIHHMSSLGRMLRFRCPRHLTHIRPPCMGSNRSKWVSPVITMKWTSNSVDIVLFLLFLERVLYLPLRTLLARYLCLMSNASLIVHSSYTVYTCFQNQ